MLHWEEINHDNGFYLRRARVVNGWLVSAIYDVLSPTHYSNGYITSTTGYQWQGSLTFVPDPNHEWNLK